jgi:hypothetical protein
MAENRMSIPPEREKGVNPSMGGSLIDAVLC